MRAITLAVCAAALSLAIIAPGTSAATCTGADRQPSAMSSKATRTAVLCLLNTERRKAGLRVLRENSALRGAATRYSRQMVAQQFFAHESPDGSTLTSRIKRTSYLKGARSWALGENLAWGQGDRATPRSIVRSWMQSPGHRANILTPRFADIGIGIAPGTPEGGSGATYTNAFGRRS